MNASGIACQPGEEAAKLDLLIDKGRTLAKEAGGDAPFPERPSYRLFDEIGQQSGNAKLKYVLDERDAIKQSLQQWDETADKIQKRRSDWFVLKDLLDQSQGLSFQADIQAEVSAIEANRSLLDEPNPITNLSKQLVDKLREAVQYRVDSYLEQHAKYLAQLEDDSYWQQLDTTQKNEILNKFKLTTFNEPALNNADAIIDALNEVNFEQWRDRTDALASNFDRARMDAIQRLQPKLQRITLPRATFETEEDVNIWLAQVKAQVLDKLSDGPVTF